MASIRPSRSADGAVRADALPFTRNGFASLMSIHDAVQYVGHFCAVTTRHGKLFGEFARHSALAFFVRQRWPGCSEPVLVDVREIISIEPLPESHR